MIIGSAISTILKSFVDELIVPLTGLISKVDFSNMYFVLKGTVPDGTPLGEARKVAGAVVLGQYAEAAAVVFLFAVAQALEVRKVRVANELGCARNTVILWRTRFLQLGLAGLQDAPRSGRPRSFSPR